MVWLAEGFKWWKQRTQMSHAALKEIRENNNASEASAKIFDNLGSFVAEKRL